MQKQNGTEINILLPVTEFTQVLLVAERKEGVRAVVVAVVVAAVVVSTCMSTTTTTTTTTTTVTTTTMCYCYYC